MLRYPISKFVNTGAISRIENDLQDANIPITYF